MGFWNEETKTLHLSFKEGSGNPVDSSDYNNQVLLRGETCKYVEDVPPVLAGMSKYSMALNMNLGVSAPETCYVEIPRPTMWINGEHEAERTGGWTMKRKQSE